MSRANARDQIRRVLTEFSVPVDLSGYKYLIDAVELTMSDANVLTSLDKFLYPVLAKRYGISPKAVQLSMAHAIHEALNDLSNDLLWDTLADHINYHTGSIGTKAFITICVEIVNKT